jgi:hypothetical protein
MSKWNQYEYPSMHNAGTIRRMKDNALKETDVEFEMEIPEERNCAT